MRLFLFLLFLFLLFFSFCPRLTLFSFLFFLPEEELALASEKLGDIVLPSFGDLAAQMDKETGGSKQSEIDALQADYEGWSPSPSLPFCSSQLGQFLNLNQFLKIISAKAGPLSSWIEEHIASFDNREFNSANQEQLVQLIRDMEVFSQYEKPDK